MLCEKCKKEHNGSYASGRFCSPKCARSFSTLNKRQKINQKVSKRLKGNRCIKGGLLKLCDYGCGQKAKYQLKNGKWCCEDSCNKCLAIREKNSISIKKVHNENRGRTFSNEDILKSHKSRLKNLKEKYNKLSFNKLPSIEKYRIVLKEQDRKCLFCKINKWNKKSIKLQIDHINGDNQNENRENLRYLCPNCHSQTNTYCGKNINIGIKKVSDKVLLKALKKTKNIHQALKLCGLTTKGRNYNRAYKLMENQWQEKNSKTTKKK